MERLSKALNVLSNSKKQYDSAPPDSRKVATYEKEKNALLELKDTLIHKDLRKDSRFNEQFSRAIEILFVFISHRNSDVRLVAEQTLTSVFRHMVLESNSSRVVVALLVELKRNGGARSLVVAFSLLSEVIDLIKPNRTGVIGAHIVGALCSIVRRPEDSVQNCMEKILPRIFSVFARQFTTHRSEDSYNLYKLAVENLELSGSSSRAASMVIYQLSLYFPEIRKKSFKQFRVFLASAEEEKKNVLVGTINTLKLLWPSMMSRNGDFDVESIAAIIRDVLRCLYSPHNDVVVAALEFLEMLFGNFLLFVNSLPFSPSSEIPRVTDVADDDAESVSEIFASHEASSVGLSSLNSSFGDPVSGMTSPSFCDGSVSSSDRMYASCDDNKAASDKGTISCLDDEEILDPLRHGTENFSDDEEPCRSSASSSSDNLSQQFDMLSIPTQLPTDIGLDSFAEYVAVLLARRFLLSDQCLKQIPDQNVRVSHKILAMNCLAHLANCLPNFCNIPLRSPAKVGSPLLKDIQLFISHDDDLLKAATITAIINASRAAFYFAGHNFTETTVPFKKCVLEVMQIRRAQCSRALLLAVKDASEVIYRLGMTDLLCKFACESSKDNYFLLRIAVVEYLASIEWWRLDNWSRSLPEAVFVAYLGLLADGEPRVAKAAATSFSLLVSNSNYCKLPTVPEIDQPCSPFCSSFGHEPLTVALGKEYHIPAEKVNACYSENLSLILARLFTDLEESANELQQAGLIAGLASLASAFPPSQYSASWNVDVHSDTTRIGLLVSLLSQCTSSYLNLNAICNLFEVISFLYAGICTATLTKHLMAGGAVRTDPPPKLLDAHLMDQLILASLRVLNMYYTLVIEREQTLSVLKSAVLSPTMSPVRKNTNAGQFATEQRIQTIANLAGTGIKPSKNSSFLQSSTLSHVVDSLRGMYSNYMDGLSGDVKAKFIRLLVSALNNLSCVLEMAYFPNVSSTLREILFYCRLTIDLAPAETARLVIQLLKVLFGRNAVSVSLGQLQKLPSSEPACTKDLLEAMLVRSANCFTEFIVTTGRKEFYLEHLLKCSGWLRKDVFFKGHLTQGAIVSENIGVFENFVSKTIRLFYTLNSYSFQVLTLELLCELLCGGINFSMLDPKMTLSNFLFTFINEFGSRNWFNSETVDSEEVTLIRSVFKFFTIISRIENEGQPVLEPRRMVAFCEVMINAAIAKPQLARCALNSLQIVLLEFVAVRKRFEQFMTKVICLAEPLAKICPTEYIEIWSVHLYSALNYGEDQSWPKVSLTFFDSFQKLDTAWNMDSAFNGMLALRLCSPATFRPLDSFLKKLFGILQSNEINNFDRLLYASPYLFVFLCVMDDDCVLPRMELVLNLSPEMIARLFIDLLFGCVSDMRNLSLPDRMTNGREYCRRAVWFLQALSYSIRSGNMKSITARFFSCIPDELVDVYDLSFLYPGLFVSFLAFYSVLELRDYKLFDFAYERDLSLLCKLIQLRCGCIKDFKDALKLLDHCGPEDLSTIIAAAKSSQFLRKCTTEEINTFCQRAFDLSKQFSSVPCMFEVLNLINADGKPILEDEELLSSVSGYSYALDRCFSSLCRDISFQTPLASPDVFTKQQNVVENTSFPNDDNAKDSFKAGERNSSFSLNFVEPSRFDDESLCELIVSLINNAGNDLSSSCVAHIFPLFDTASGEKILRTAYATNRFDIIAGCIDELAHMNVTAFNWGEMYSEYSVVSVRKAENLCQVCVDLAFDIALNSPLQLYAQSMLAEKCSEAFVTPAKKWAADPKRFRHWLHRYAEILSVDEMDFAFLEPEVINAVAFGVSQPSFMAATENADLREMIEKQLVLGENLARILKAAAKKLNSSATRREAGRMRLNWDIVIHDRSGKKDLDLEFFSESVQTAFELVMRIQDAFRKKLVTGYLLQSLQKLAKAVTRLPLFNDVACIPRMALLCKWRVEIEIRSASIAVSTVNVHHLCNVDVLRDFTWRLCWAGWNRHANFNNFSMSLFGVLSSTPTGSELQTASLNVTEQIMASTAAVEGLTNILLQTMLFPERGNPVVSRFMVRHREMPTEFILTPYGQRLCMLKAKLTNSTEMHAIYQTNLEFSDSSLKIHGPGQFSVHAIWNMTGVLDQERNLFKDNPTSNFPSPRKSLPSSDSSYLLESGHDSTNESCLRMLFDIYSHWFRAGVDAVPLSLLSAIVKSMLLLSDLFVELDQFEFVFNHMKVLFGLRSHIENVDLGNAICGVLKCVAVLGLEGVSLLKADVQKLVTNCVECGLTSTFSEIRIRTLQGILYILQSISHEDLRAILPFIQSFLLNELSIRSPGMDPVNMEIEFESREYETLLWSVGFYLCENLLYSTEDFRTTLIDFVFKVFNSTLSPVWLMDLLTSGAERLIVSSRTYITPFNRIAIQMMKNYFTIPNKFIFSLRIAIACLYHGMHEGSLHRIGLEPYDSQLILMEQFPIIFKILAEGSEEDASLMLKVLPYLLIDSLNQSEIINNVLKELIHRYQKRPHPRPKAIFTIVHHWFSVLRSRETEAVVLDWTLNGLDSFRYIVDSTLFRFYVNAFLCSSSANPYVASLFHIIVSRSGEAMWLDDLWFPFIARSLLSRLDLTARKKLRDRMEVYICDGIERRDPARVRNFPTF